MIRGERGAQGDAGHPGHEGQRGIQGIQGPKGERGITSTSFHRSLAALMVFVVASFVILGAVMQKRDQDMCESRVANIARTNHLYRGLIRIEQDNPFRFTSPKTVQDRIDLFTQALLEPPTCKQWWEL